MILMNKNITKKINNDGTINLLKLADQSDVKKFIYMSSASVYGFSDKIMNETSEVNPLTEYSRAKVANEIEQSSPKTHPKKVPDCQSL